MALMFPRLARNFARNGYYPTDEITLERTLQAHECCARKRKLHENCF